MTKRKLPVLVTVDSGIMRPGPVITTESEESADNEEMEDEGAGYGDILDIIDSDLICSVVGIENSPESQT